MYEMHYIALLIWSAYVTHFTFPCFFLIVQACKAHAHLYDFALGGECVKRAGCCLLWKCCFTVPVFSATGVLYAKNVAW